MKKCPPGVICIENFSLFFILICLLILCYIVKIIYSSNSNNLNKLNKSNQLNNSYLQNSLGLNNSNMQILNEDALINPYNPPLRDERYFIPYGNRMPINISTNIGAVDTTYRQLGLLTALNSKGKIIPLMGRPLFTNRNKWQYYTISNQNNAIKLPISRNGKSCTNEYGCDQLYNGDTVYVEGLNEPYIITLYDNDTIKYLPYI